MITLLEAIEAKVQVTPALTEGLTGGVHVHQHPQGGAKPYAVIDTISTDQEYQTGEDVIDRKIIQVSFYASYLSEIKTSVAAWKKAFTWKDLTLSDGTVFGSKLNNEYTGMDTPENTELSLPKLILEFEFWIDTALMS